MRLLAALLLLVSTETFASEPIYEAAVQGIRVVAYKEKCALEAVANLPLRAVWFQDGKEIEGCIGARDDLGVAVAYFADKTIVVFPLEIFRKLTGV